MNIPSYPADARIDRLSGDFIIYQPCHGQRYTTDDLLAAWLAVREARNRAEPPSRFLDLGSGLCSVPMILLWAFPELRGTGIEISPVRFGLGRASLKKNNVSGRFDLKLGDLRQLKLGRWFPLVTSSPPYYHADEGPLSPDQDKAGVRFELHGSIEDYCRTAQAHLEPGGMFITVYPHQYRERALDAARGSGLCCRREVRVLPRQGKPVLLSLFCFSQAADPSTTEVLAIRGADGLFTPAFRQVRRDLGFPDKLT